MSWCIVFQTRPSIDSVVVQVALLTSCNVAGQALNDPGGARACALGACAGGLLAVGGNPNVKISLLKKSLSRVIQILEIWDLPSAVEDCTSPLPSVNAWKWGCTRVIRTPTTGSKTQRSLGANRHTWILLLRTRHATRHARKTVRGVIQGPDSLSWLLPQLHPPPSITGCVNGALWPVGWN